MVAQIFRLASLRVREMSQELKPGTWAVAVDVDDTVLSTAEYNAIQAAQGTGYTPATWEAWISLRQAPPLPGVRNFLTIVKESGGRVALVTNRSQRVCAATEDNLKHVDVVFDVLLCRGKQSAKSDRWQRIQNGTAAPDLPPLQIVMWVGDGASDFPGISQGDTGKALEEFGHRFIILPNPQYGSWLQPQ